MGDQDRWNDRRDHLDQYGRPNDPYGEFGYDQKPDPQDPHQRNERQRRAESRRSEERHDNRFAPFGAAGPVASQQGTYDDNGEPYGSGWGQVRDDGRARYARGRDEGYGRDRHERHGHDDHIEDRARHAGREARSWWDRATERVSNLIDGDDAGRARHAGPEERGAYRGLGPKGYRRSDERIREDVSDRLTDDPYLDASDIEVAVANSEVTLSGSIRRREDKRRAENLTEAISGVTHVQNNLRVAQSPAQGDAGLGDLSH